MSSSLVDHCWELVDPCPDVRALFLQFNDQFFGGKLAGCEVRWSPKMTLCAGLCSYEGRGGLCSVRLSQPLLKLRPRKDLVETLLHEMIHAYLFVTENNRDHDAHGASFHSHMNRINGVAGTRISVYHTFHAEVASYKQHWWRCQGPCKDRKPYFGWVKRAMNRAPGPSDFWWEEHQKTCGGKYVKVKEPDGYKAPKKKTEDKNTNSVSQKKPGDSSQQREITAFFGKGYVLGSSKSSENQSSSNLVTSSSSAISSKAKNPAKKPKIEEVPTKIDSAEFSGKGYVLGSSKAGKTANNLEDFQSTSNYVSSPSSSCSENGGKGSDFEKVSNDEVAFVQETVKCPVCTVKVPLGEINGHLDTCLV